MKFRLTWIGIFILAALYFGGAAFMELKPFSGWITIVGQHIVGAVGLVGPRPFLVRDCVFLTDEQRRRHTVRPGLTGLAQVNGQNNITWEQKFEYDLQYIDRGITFIGDLKIILQTIGKVLKRSDIVREGTVSDIDYGDRLMMKGQVTKEEYEEKQTEARELLNVWCDLDWKKSIKK